MKKLLLPLLILIAAFAKADDTATLNTAFAAGNVTLISGHTYNISGTLNITHAVNMNGAIINSIITGSGVPAVKLSTDGASISNGTITGPWLYTSSADPSGYVGIRILANNVKIDHVNISQFSSYGILCNNFNNPTITYCQIFKVGYIGFFYIPEANTIGGTFSNNTVDRSMLASTTIQQGAVQIRASTANSLLRSTGWTISNNTIKMPFNPWQAANECMEVRNCDASTISNNVCIQGTIGVSVVNCTAANVSNNECLNNSTEGVEFAASTNCSSYNNNITGSFSQGGILLDGYNASPASPGCSNITLVSDHVTNTKTGGIGIQIAPDNGNININSGVISAVYEGINVIKSTNISVTNTAISGATYGILLDTAPGNLTINGGSISNATAAVFAYNTQTNALVDNIGVFNTSLISTPTQISSTFSNGAHFGTNIHFSNYTPVSVSWFNVQVVH